MSAQPWGRTGLVTLTVAGTLRWGVGVDGRSAGMVYTYLPGSWVGTSGSSFGVAYYPDGAQTLGPPVPTLDAAVMWVLRRAAPKVWREERGPVPSVRLLRGVSSGIPGWHIQGGDIECPCIVRIPATWTECMAAIAREATS